MCYSVYIGINEKQEPGKFVPNLTDIYFEKPSEEDEIELKQKFSKPYIYYVGSDTCCSCGLQFNSGNFNEPDEEINKKSPTKLIDFLKEKTKTEDIEFYCCWGDSCNEPIIYNRVININEISLEKNYFGLIENEFILFRNSTID